MSTGKDWQRRLPAVLHLAQVVSAMKDAGAFEPQMMPAHEAAALAARVARLARLEKAAPATATDWLGTPLAKAFPLVAAANIAAAVGPMIASSRWGQRAMRWGTRALLRPAVRSTARAVNAGTPVSGARSTMAPGPTMSGLAGYGLRTGRSSWGRLRRNPGRAALGMNRHVYNNRGSYALAAGTALGGYETDRTWREASARRRAMRET